MKVVAITSAAAMAATTRFFGRTLQRRYRLAARWFSRLQSDRATPGDYRGFLRWLSASPKNRFAYRRINAIWLHAPLQGVRHLLAP